jgi:FkbM family methyltransferase
MPFGRYRLIHETRRVSMMPFVSRLSHDFGGLAFVCDPRDSVAREACYSGSYEPQETQIASRLLRMGDVFVDVGANWGYFTLVAAAAVGPAGRVRAFEPEPRLFELLRRNLELNGLRWAQACRIAIAEHAGRLPFAAFAAESGNWGVSHAVTSDAPSDFHVEAAPLDDVLDEAGISSVRLTKIDVEGGEAAVLAGMRRGLESGRFQYVLLECHPQLLADRGCDESSVLQPLVVTGYRVWTVVHTPAVHRLAARNRLPATAMLRPYVHGAFAGAWPHLVAAAPGVPDIV